MNKPVPKLPPLTPFVTVMDLEATCWLGHPPTGMRQEIIEVGVAPVNTNTLDITPGIGLLCRPQNSTVSEFCTKLTSLTEDQLRDQPTFQEQCKYLETSLDSKNRMWISWGEYDKKQVHRDVTHHGIDSPFDPSKHLNLKEFFAKKKKLKQPCGLENALKHLGLEFVGNPHRGKDDAYNTARVLVALIQEERDNK